MTRLSLTSPTIVARAQSRKTTVATCVSANGKPTSVIKWDTLLKGDFDFKETRNANGTVTVRSNYMVTPNSKMHKMRLTCIVRYRSEHITDSVVLNVQCKSLAHLPPPASTICLIVLLLLCFLHRLLCPVNREP